MSKEFALTPSKGPYVGRTLSDVHILRHELDTEKLKNRQLAQTVRQIIDISKLPKEEFTWYKLLGGNTMRKTRRSKRGGQPITEWSSSVTQAATPVGLPGASSMPDSSPRLFRSDAMRSPSSSPVRRLDFSRLGIAQDPPGCVPISKRLPGHRNDQCEESDSASGYDRSICKQPGDEGVQLLSDCGPVRAGVGGKKRKTSKTKKSTRRRRHSRRR